jgi:hypothetical protein
VRWEAASVCQMQRRITGERSIPAMSDERSHRHCAAMIVPVREDHGAPQDAEEPFRLQGYVTAK